MSEGHDPRVAIVLMCKDHLGYKPMQDIARWLVSDQSQIFHQAPFASKGVFGNSGGLVQATLTGYRAMRMLHKTAEVLYANTEVDRLVALYVSLMISRAIEIPTGRQTMVEGHGSVSTVSVINALAFGMCDLRPGEVQALTKWWASRVEMVKEHEPFNAEWWVLAETMNWVFVANRR